MFKLIFILFGVIIIYGIIMFLIPIFQVIGFVGEGVNEFQNIFEEMEKHYQQLYMEEKLYSQRYGGDTELIDVEKCEDSGMGDDQHQKP